MNTNQIKQYVLNDISSKCLLLVYWNDGLNLTPFRNTPLL